MYVKSLLVKNTFYNLLATMLPTMMLQLVIYPLYSKIVSQEQYGNMITIISIITIFSISVGNVLNNVRLLRQNDYLQKDQFGDFLYLFFIEVVIAGIIITFILIRICDIEDTILTVITMVIVAMQSYAIVAFIQKLDYKRVLMNNIILLVGYFLGFTICLVFQKKWQFIYIIGNLFSVIYIQKESHILTEGCSKSILYKETRNKTISLSVAGLIASGNNYLDRVLIEPMLGSEAVTIYYISTLVGKMVGQVISPINSILLAYLSKQKEVRPNLEQLIIRFSWCVAVIGYIGCVLVSNFVLTILYPDYCNEAENYVVINTFTAMIYNCDALIAPFLLKCCSSGWQVLINIVSLAGLVFFSVFGYKVSGLFGYSMGVLVIAAIKYFMQYIILKYKK